MADAEDITTATPSNGEDNATPPTVKSKRPHPRRSKKNLKRTKKAEEEASRVVEEDEEDDAKDLSEADNAGAVFAGNTMAAPAPLASLLEEGAAIEQEAGNENELAGLRREIDTFNRRHEGYYEDLRLARNERDEARNEVSTLKRENGAMTRELIAVKAQKETACQAQADLEQRIEKIEKDLAEQKKRAAAAHNLADAKVVTIDEQKADLKQKDIELERTKKELDDKKGMVTAMHGDADKLEESLKDNKLLATVNAELVEELHMISERLDENLGDMAKDLTIEEKFDYLQDQRFTKLRRDESQASLNNHHRRSNSRMVSLGSIQDELDIAGDTFSDHGTEFEKEPQPLALSSIIMQATKPQQGTQVPMQHTVHKLKEVIIYRDRATTVAASKPSSNRWTWTSLLNALLFLLLLSLSYSAAVARKEWRDVNDMRPAYLRGLNGEGVWDTFALGMGGVLVGSP